MTFRFQNSYSRATTADSFGRPNHPGGGFGAPTPSAAGRETSEASGRLHALLELSAALTFPLLFASALLLSYYRLAQAGAGWLAAAGVLLGLVFGDFITGLVHWAADTYGEESTPVIGRSLVKPFRVHHVRPQEICEHGIVETVGNTCILAAPLLALCLAFAAHVESSAAAAFSAFTAVVTLGVTVATNQFHKWAHRQDPPRLVRLLQRSKLILGPEHHQTHHAEPFQSSYAITNGWLNPLLNRSRFFRRLEAALRAFGIEPSRER